MRLTNISYFSNTVRIMVLLLVTLVALFSVHTCDAFAGVNTKTKAVIKNKATELPRYDGKLQKWIPTGPNQLPDAGYPPTKTLFLQGPRPFITRIFQPDDYEQAVLKFMAGDQITSRDKAQGNMDAYLRNPQDWMFNRMESQRKGFEIDYTKISTKDVVLVTVWSGIVVYFTVNFTSKYVLPLIQ
jgi:hypothetical protein